MSRGIGIYIPYIFPICVAPYVIMGSVVHPLSSRTPRYDVEIHSSGGEAMRHVSPQELQPAQQLLEGEGGARPAAESGARPGRHQ